MGGGVFRVPSTAGKGRNGTGCTNEESVSTALVLNKLNNNNGKVHLIGGKKNGFEQGKLLPERTVINNEKKKRSRKLKDEQKKLIEKKVKLNGTKLKDDTDGILLDDSTAFKANGEVLDENAKRKELFKGKLYESISKMIKGYSKGKLLMPPIDKTQIGQIADFYYMQWVAENYPGDKDARIELGAYDSDYGSMLVTAKAEFMGQGEKQEEFFLEARRLVMGTVRDIAREYESFAEKLKAMAAAHGEKVAEYERRIKESPAVAEKVYAGKEARLAELLAIKPTSIEDFFKKLGVPAGGALISIVASTFKATVIDITEHIPLLAVVPPELIGLGIIGAWGVYRIAKAIMNWYRSTRKIRIPDSKETRKEEDIELAISRKKEEGTQYPDEVKSLKQAFQSFKEGMLAKLREEYGALLSEYHFASSG